MRGPVFARNGDVIRDALARILEGAAGEALEIGSGTGEHVCHFAPATPGLRWTPSDPDPRHRVSINAWIRATGAPVAPPVDLDASADWAGDCAGLTAIFSANVIHIAPWRVTEGTFAGAGRALAPGGSLIFYGPFQEGGRHTGDGNAAFDENLRARNPDWGLRDIDDLARLARENGLTGPVIEAMPANNRMLIFGKP